MNIFGFSGKVGRQGLDGNQNNFNYRQTDYKISSWWRKQGKLIQSVLFVVLIVQIFAAAAGRIYFSPKGQKKWTLLQDAGGITFYQSLDSGILYFCLVDLNSVSCTASTTVAKFENYSRLTAKDDGNKSCTWTLNTTKTRNHSILLNLMRGW